MNELFIDLFTGCFKMKSLNDSNYSKGVEILKVLNFNTSIFNTMDDSTNSNEDKINCDPLQGPCPLKAVQAPLRRCPFPPERVHPDHRRLSWQAQ